MTQNQDDDWVSAAMADDSAVAELLTLFRRPSRPLKWSVRQRRSKPKKGTANSKPKPRASPTTPLSWSGATSASVGDGSENSSRLPSPKHPDGPRSTVTAGGGINTNKRSKKKKTLVELKEEETLLVKERRHLKRQLATLLATLENQRAVNESLKRYKIDLQSQPPLERVLVSASTEANPNQMQLQDASFDHPSSSISLKDIRNEDCESLTRITPPPENSSKKFVLPDLNLPLDKQLNVDVLYSQQR